MKQHRLSALVLLVVLGFAVPAPLSADSRGPIRDDDSPIARVVKQMRRFVNIVTTLDEVVIPKP